MAIPVTVLFGNPPQDIDLSASNEILDDTVVAALTFLATMAVTSRLVIKKRKYGRLQADDWFILLALVCNHSNPGFEDTFAHIQQKFGEYGTAACTLAVWLPMTVACRPMDHFWNQYTGETNGSCINYLSMWIITGIFSAALDLLILLLPIPIIWSLKTHWSKKLPVSCLLALGTLVVIAAVIRLVYMSHMMHATDITWALGPAQIWTSLEPSQHQGKAIPNNDTLAEIQSIGEHKFEIGVLAEDKYVPSLHSQAALTSGSCIATITSTCYSQLRKVVDQCNTASVHGKQGGAYHDQCAEWYLLSL
ncbi:hypothetical protein KCU67_g608, partial [Aureobasidium melanogenum]